MGVISFSLEPNRARKGVTRTMAHLFYDGEHSWKISNIPKSLDKDLKPLQDIENVEFLRVPCHRLPGDEDRILVTIAHGHMIDCPAREKENQQLLDQFKALKKDIADIIKKHKIKYPVFFQSRNCNCCFKGCLE